MTTPHGRIIFAGKLVPAVLPEWWGAVHDDGAAIDLSVDSTAALQAAIDAACVTRDYPEPGATAPSPRPSLPVLLSGPYLTHRTLTVNVEQSFSERHLILRGRAGLGSPNLGVASIKRFRTNVTERVPEDAEGCVLRLGANTSFEFEDVNLSVNEDATQRPNEAPVDRRVDGCVDLDGRDDAGPAHRGLLRRCTLVGGARYALRIRAEDPSPLRHIEAVDCCIAGHTPRFLSLHSIELAAGVSTMFHVEGALLGVGLMPVSTYPTIESLPDNAMMYLQGGSVLVQGSQMQSSTGPRPSRGLMLQGRRLGGSVWLEEGLGESVVDLGTVFDATPTPSPFISGRSRQAVDVLSLSTPPG